jgi:hypothetical protein
MSHNSAAADRLERAILKRHGTAKNALRALGFDSGLISEITQENNMNRSNDRRRARDDEPLSAEGAMQEVEELFELLPEQDRGKFVDALRERLSGGGEDRRRRIGKDMPPVYPRDLVRGPTVGLPPDPLVSLPPDREDREEDEGAQDRRRGGRDRRRHAMDSATRLPNFAEIWSGRG